MSEHCKRDRKEGPMHDHNDTDSSQRPSKIARRQSSDSDPRGPDDDDNEPRKIFQRQDGLLLYLLSCLNVSDVVRFKRVNKRWMDLCTGAIAQNFQPRKEFETNEELKEIVRKYCQYDKEDIDEIGNTYGFPIGKWEVGRIEHFGFVFCGRTTFNEDIGSWDMSNAKTLRYMFSEAATFNRPLENWNTSKVEDMECMFENASAFNQSVSTWDTRKVEEMEAMFWGAISFNQPITSWIFDSLQSYEYMFLRATAFQQELPDAMDAQVACIGVANGDDDYGSFLFGHGCRLD